MTDKNKKKEGEDSGEKEGGRQKEKEQDKVADSDENKVKAPLPNANEIAWLLKKLGKLKDVTPVFLRERNGKSEATIVTVKDIPLDITGFEFNKIESEAIATMYDKSEIEPVVYVLLPPFNYEESNLEFFVSNVLSLKFSGEVVMLYQGNSKRHHMLI